MKRLIMTMVMAVVMSLTVSAQRINNTIKEARILTDKMVEELNLNNWQREKAYQMNLDYLNGINGRNDIHSQIWSYRNKQIMGILSSSQWQLFKKSSYFYQPISWKKEHTYITSMQDTQMQVILLGAIEATRMLLPLFLVEDVQKS